MSEWLPELLQNLIEGSLSEIFPKWKITFNWIIVTSMAGLSIWILPKLFAKDMKRSLCKWIKEKNSK